jgi:subtilase family serine protease
MQNMSHVRPACAKATVGFFQCYALVRTDVVYSKPPQYRAVTGVADADLGAAAANSWYYPLEPAQLQQAYNLPSSSAGKGQTVGIVDAFGDPNAEADLQKYRKAFKLPKCNASNGCLQILNQNGQSSPLPSPPTGSNLGWAVETALDLDMVSAICPNCKIVLIQANTNSSKNLGIAVGAAKNAGAGQISNSYGGPECVINKKGKIVCFAKQIQKYAKYYNLPGTILTASSGDFTWYAGPQSPADLGTVVSVGGTSLYPFNNSRGWIETAWSGAGSSCSTFSKRPSWVKLSKSLKCPGDTRAISDVSAVSDPNTGVLVYMSYPYSAGFYVVGGTSVASPIIASVYALAGNASTQNFGAALYNAGKNLTDVTIGKNASPDLENNAGQVCGSNVKGGDPTAICASMPGWDGPTGNGTPWGVGAF